ncbi:unnamed protein product, partial [Musa banksii]
MSCRRRGIGAERERGQCPSATRSGGGEDEGYPKGATGQVGYQGHLFPPRLLPPPPRIQGRRRQCGTGRCRRHHRLRHHHQRQRGRRHQNGGVVEQGHAQRSSELYGPMELVSDEGVNIARRTDASHGEALRSVGGWFARFQKDNCEDTCPFSGTVNSSYCRLPCDNHDFN